MSEEQILPVEDVAEQTAMSVVLKPGAILRAARESQGLHIAMLAVALKVPVKKLEALESDRFDLLPDMVFVRALAASVCRALKVDPTTVLAAMPCSVAPNIKTDESGLNARYRDSSHSHGDSLMTVVSRPFSAAALLLVIGILAIIFWPVNADVVAAAPVIDSTSGGIQGASESVPASTSSRIESLSAVPSFVISETPPTTAHDLSVPVSPENSSAATGVLTMRAKGNSWVEVIDSNGVVQMRRTLAENDNVSLNGAQPLSVVLGRADMIEVSVRGQPFDVVPMTKDNVARFEVK
jgi:cytoskeleton protein RodZ